MKPVERTGVLEQVLRSLNLELQSGAWDQKVPGSRTLAAKLQVSQPTVAEALKRLANKGQLEGGGERRAYRVAKPRETASAPVAALLSARHLIIITQHAVASLQDRERDCVLALQDQMTRKGWDVDFKVLDSFHTIHPRLAWDAILEPREGTLIVAVQGRPALAEWAIRRSIPILFFGGVGSPHPIPVVGINAVAMTREAVRQLVSLGHSHITLPLLDRSPAFAKKISEALQDELKAAGIAYFQSYHTPTRDYTGPAVIELLMDELIKTRRPSAWMFFDINEMITAFSVLAKHRMRVPQDASLILLGDSPEAGWFAPTIAKFRFPIKVSLGRIIRWLESGGAGLFRLQSRALFEPGNSIGPHEAEATSSPGRLPGI